MSGFEAAGLLMADSKRLLLVDYCYSVFSKSLLYPSKNGEMKMNKRIIISGKCFKFEFSFVLFAYLAQAVLHMFRT